MAKTTVLYIAGWGRSGSTIIGNILGQLPGFFHVGEIGYLWRRAIVEDAKCGCGVPFSACPVWKKILGDAFEGAAEETARRMMDLKLKVVPTHRDLFLDTVMPGTGALQGRAGHAEFAQNLARLYGAIADQGPNRVIVDSSKHPAYLYALAQVPELDVRVLHLVRDPRATTYSWLRKIDRTDARGKLEMERFSVWESASRWVSWNAAVTMVARRTGVPVTRMSYESFVEDPREALRQVLSIVGDVAPVPQSALPFVGSHEVELKETHTVWGNPSRQRTGRVQINPDDEWVSALSTWDKALVTGLTYPLAHHYGYFSRASRREAASSRERAVPPSDPAPASSRAQAAQQDPASVLAAGRRPPSNQTTFR